MAIISVDFVVPFQTGGGPATGLTPQITIYRVDTGAVVAGPSAMTAIGASGQYRFTLATYDTTLNYAFEADGGSTLEDEERFKQGNTINTPPEEIVDQVWDEPSAGHLVVGSVGEQQARLDAAVSSRESTATAAASHAQTQADIAALNDIDQTGVQAALTAQGYTPARALLLDNADVAVSSRESEADALTRATADQLEHDTTQLAIGALNDIDQAGVQAAMTAQNYTVSRGLLLDNLDAAITTRQSEADASTRATADINAHLATQALVNGLNDLSIADVQTALTNQGYTVARATLLDNLDALISSRATPADIPAQLTLQGYTVARATLLDNLDALVSSRAVAGDAMNLVANALTSGTLDTTAVNEIRDAILSDSTPFDGADIAAILAAVNALNDIDQSDVQAALTAQGYTAARAILLDFLDVAVSSRSSHSAADVDTVLTGTHGAGSWQSGAAGPTAAAIATEILNRNLSAHLTANTVGDAIARGLFDRDHAVWIDVSAGAAGTAFPLGTERSPVNNWADAATIAAARGMDTFVLIGSNNNLNLTAATVKKRIIGLGSNITVQLNNFQHTSLQLENVQVSGTAGGTSTLRLYDCLISGTLGPIIYEAYRCALRGTLAFQNSGRSIFFDCYTDDSAAAGPAILNMAGLSPGVKVSLKNYSGDLEVQGMNAAVSELCVAGDGTRLTLAASNVQGDIALYGDIKLNDLSTITTTRHDLEEYLETRLATDHGAGAWDGTASVATVQAGLTAQGYTVARAPLLDNLDAAVSSRADAPALAAAQGDITTILGQTTSGGPGPWTTGAAAATPAAIATEILNRDLAAHLTAGSAGKGLALAGHADDAVWVQIPSASGTAWPLGTKDSPVDNFADAQAIAFARGLRKIKWVGGFASSATLTAGLSNVTVEAAERGFVLNLGNQSISTSVFENMTLTGLYIGVLQARNCRLSGVNTTFAGSPIRAFRCGLRGTTVVTGAAGFPSIFEDCYSDGNPASSVPVIDAGGANNSISLKGYRGPLELAGMDAASSELCAAFESGRLILGATNTAGATGLYGAVDLDDTSGAGHTVTRHDIEQFIESRLATDHGAGQWDDTASVATIQAGLTAQGYSVARAPLLDNLDATVSSRATSAAQAAAQGDITSILADTAAMQPLIDVAVSTRSTPDEAADAVWDEPTAAHTTPGTFGAGTPSAIGPGAISLSSYAADVVNSLYSNKLFVDIDARAVAGDAVGRGFSDNPLRMADVPAASVRTGISEVTSLAVQTEGLLFADGVSYADVYFTSPPGNGLISTPGFLNGSDGPGPALNVTADGYYVQGSYSGGRFSKCQFVGPTTVTGTFNVVDSVLCCGVVVSVTGNLFLMVLTSIRVEAGPATAAADAVIDFTACTSAPIAVNLVNVSYGLTFRGVGAAQAGTPFNINLNGATVTLEASVTEGNWNFTGIGRVVDNSTGNASVNTDGLIPPSPWDSLRGDHTIAGSFGEALQQAVPTVAGIADAVLSENVTDHFTNLESLAGFLRIIKGLSKGNMMLDETVYNGSVMTDGRIRLFDTKAALDGATDGGAGEGEFVALTVDTEVEALDATLVKTVKVGQN